MLTIRVAMAAGAVVAVAYLLIAVVVAVAVSNNLVAQIDGQLSQALVPVPVQPSPLHRPMPDRQPPPRPSYSDDLEIPSFLRQHVSEEKG